MNSDERDLRRALETRSGAPTPEFRARLNALLAGSQRVPNLAPAIALVAAVAITLGTVSVLVMARNAHHGPSATLNQASGARLESPSPTPASGTRLENPTPTVSPTSPEPAALSCRLPITIELGQTTSIHGAFISFPNAEAVDDPAGEFTANAATNVYQSNVQPYLRGSVQNLELFFDRALNRWLPNSRAAVYPDGSAYAYITTSTSGNLVHIVEVASGRERVLPIAHPFGYSAVMDYSTNGIYVAGASEGSEAAVWLVNPASGSERIIAGTGRTVDLGLAGGAAWLAYTQNPNQYTGGWDTIDRLDLATGQRTLWFHRDGAKAVGVGFASDGTPVMYPSFSSGTSEVWLTSSPQNRLEIFSGVETFTAVASDSHGLWLSSRHGIYFYTSQSGFNRVSSVIGVPAGSCA
jgi:hypothetical protein